MKKMNLDLIIKWSSSLKILNIIPRPQLIKLSNWLRPIIALFLKGTKYTDPIDGKSYRKFLPYGYQKIRKTY